MTNPTDQLILIKGADQTANVRSLRADPHKPLIYVTYQNGKEYTYRKVDITILQDPVIVTVQDRIVLKHNVPLSNVDTLQIFNRHCRILYRSGYHELTELAAIRLIDSALKLRTSQNCWDYLTQIAVHTGLVSEEHNILVAHYERIGFVRDDSILAAYLNGSQPKTPVREAGSVIFPFGFNLSQKTAVEHALRHPISIIEGPPGTGKTQTILNIIANAVMRGERVAVVSNTNAATDNVLEKLQKYGVGFIAAPLGSAANRQAFLEAQDGTLPDMTDWYISPHHRPEPEREQFELEQKLDLQNQLALTTEKLHALEVEYAHFRSYYETLTIDGPMPIFRARVSEEEILAFMAEYECMQEEFRHLSPWKRLIMRIKYNLKHLRFRKNAPDKVLAYCQNEYYIRALNRLRLQQNEMQTSLSLYNFEERMKRYTEVSMALFRSELARRYKTNRPRRIYRAEDLRQEPAAFTADYPVVLSTTYSLCSCLAKQYMYDYVIIDEASQVNLAGGALALSCAKRVVIVGDRKQLPNVVTSQDARLTDSIFRHFSLPSAYRYSDHSILSSFTELFPDAPRVLLREHYRCHPEIIGFCNQQFYQGELIILTKPGRTEQPFSVYRTAPGNHARGHVNQRQIDVITSEIFPGQSLRTDDGSVGIVTPYRAQADALGRIFADTTVKADTADRFQGQERQVMIFSTVDNKIGDFASDPNRLNVAVSRAVERFIVVTDGNDNDASSPIHDLIGYIQYHNHESSIICSEVRSVFDCLYKQCAKARADALRKYGRISEFDSENLMYRLIRDILSTDAYSRYDVVTHVPLRMILGDLSKLEPRTREWQFATNHLTHIDFLIFSKLTREPVLVVEVDGFAYHQSEKQAERDRTKDWILEMYGIPILRLSTTGSREREQLIARLDALSVPGA